MTDGAEYAPQTVPDTLSVSGGVMENNHLEPLTFTYALVALSHESHRDIIHTVSL